MGGRGLQEGWSGGHCGWKWSLRRLSRAQFTPDRLPRIGRGGTAPQLPLALNLNP
jgi:hypothetical protein